MTLLLVFAFLAGIATVLSPCILPVLPAILAGGIGSGRLRPLGIILGLMLSFNVFTLLLSTLVTAYSLSPEILRYTAIAIMVLLGLVMLFPSWSDYFAKKTSAIAELGNRVPTSNGFWGGFFLGAALGLVWTPCAGPILAAITTLVATQMIGWETVALILTYCLGAAIPLLFIAYGGRRLLALTRYTEEIRRGFGVLMILTALAVAFHVDVRLQEWTLRYFPTINWEDNPEVQVQLASLRGITELPVGAAAPALKGIVSWVNSPPLTLEQLRGKVVLIDFWTYSCINCIRTFPYLKSWDEKYRDKGLVIIGVHTPEFAFEKDLKNVEEAAQRFGLRYPIALDNDYATWNAYSNRCWPAHYLIDSQGHIRQIHFGEGGAYGETENAIRSLLNMPLLVIEDTPKPTQPLSAELYLGSNRSDPARASEIVLSAGWKQEPEHILSTQEATLTLHFLASHVYLVMSADTPQKITVQIDGKPLTSAQMTANIQVGFLIVHEPRKYDLVNLEGHYGTHTLTLTVPSGTSAYAFTFGADGG